MPEKLCPRDSTLLATNDVDGYRYYSCPKCHGYWLPGSILRKTLTPEAARDFITRAATALTPSLSCPNGDSHLIALHLPRCEIDICPRCHSLWLDPDEARLLAHSFKHPSAIVDADQPTSAPITTGAVILDGILTTLGFFIR